MKNHFRTLLGEACSRRAAATGPIKTDAGQHPQKNSRAKGPCKIAFGSSWAKHAPEELLQPATLKPMSASIRKR